MKNITKNLIASGMMLLSSFLPMKKLEAQEINLSNNTNKYIFWAVPFSKGYVNQPSLNLSHGNLNVGTGLSIDSNNRGMNEIDFFGSLEGSINSKLDYNIGFVNFNAKNGESWINAANTHVGVNANVSLSPSITAYNIIGEESGRYLDLAVSKDFEVNGFSIPVSTSIGYNDRAFREGSSWSHLEGNASLPISLSEKLKFTPSIKAVKSLTDDIEDGFYVGANLNYKFKE